MLSEKDEQTLYLSGQQLQIYLPLRQIQEGLMFPTGGQSRNRWQIIIESDHETNLIYLIEQLNSIGFSRIQTEVKRSSELFANEGESLLNGLGCRLFTHSKSNQASSSKHEFNPASFH